MFANETLVREAIHEEQIFKTPMDFLYGDSPLYFFEPDLRSQYRRKAGCDQKKDRCNSCKNTGR